MIGLWLSDHFQDGERKPGRGECGGGGDLVRNLTAAGAHVSTAAVVERGSKSTSKHHGARPVSIRPSVAGLIISPRPRLGLSVIASVLSSCCLMSTPEFVVSARPSAARRREIRRGGSKPEVVFRAGLSCTFSYSEYTVYTVLFYIVLHCSA